MTVYLHDIPLEEAQAFFHQALQKADLDRVLRVEQIALDENAVGRVVAAPVWASLSSPHYHASAMDGFALRAKETDGAMPTQPVTLQIGPQAVYIDTGDPLPDWANAVIPIEKTEALDEQGRVAKDVRHPAAIRLRSALTPWMHVRLMGEDIVATQLVLPGGHILRPADLGALAASGCGRVPVSCSPLVGVLPTGTELVPIGEAVKKGDIIEYNSVVLAAQVKTWGGTPKRYPITKDDYALIRDRVQQAADENDLVLINAGSSAGSEDFTSRIVEELGTLLVHGVAVRPGHPVILGMIRRSAASETPGKLVPIVGVPGYPVSAALTGEIFVEPLLAKWLGRSPFTPVEVTGTLTRKVTSPAGDDDLMRVVAGQVGQKLLVAPLARGAGVITSLVKADGITIIPRGVQGLEPGQEIRVRLYRAPIELERTIFAIGSHDLTLDVVAHFLSERNRRLVSSNVGSLGGLVALKRGEGHFGGSHLLDPETGEYNLSYIEQYLPDTPLKLVSWVRREQGLLVAKGNPKSIESLADLAREDVSYVNRQRGAGTRVLLDYHLKQLGITSQQVQGYDQVEYTHLAVAAAVLSGRADCGLGVAAAAQALELDFIPLYQEQYELVIPKAHLEGDLLAPLFDLMHDKNFRQAVAAMRGYDVSYMGDIVAEF